MILAVTTAVRTVAAASLLIGPLIVLVAMIWLFVDHLRNR